MNHTSEDQDGTKSASDLSKACKGTSPPAKAARQSAAAGGGESTADVERTAGGRGGAGHRRHAPRATGGPSIVGRGAPHPLRGEAVALSMRFSCFVVSPPRGHGSCVAHGAQEMLKGPLAPIREGMTRPA